MVSPKTWKYAQILGLGVFVWRLIHAMSRLTPDPEHIWADDDGTEWYRYAIEYRDFDGRRMVFRFFALSPEDAYERMIAISETGVVLGQVLSSTDTDVVLKEC